VDNTGRKLAGLDLFSGIGGISQALEPWVRTAAYCENFKPSQAILLSRMGRGEIDIAPIWDDVTTLGAGILPRIDIIAGGFPCQDISITGLRRGLAGKRSGLFFEIARLAEELRPSFIFLENVAGISSIGGEEVVSTITQMGYDCRWGCLTSADVGYPTKRERWWLLASSNKARTEREGLERGVYPAVNCGRFSSNPPDRDLVGPESNQWKRLLETRPEIAPAVLGNPNGIQHWFDRLGALGNSVNPALAREAFQKLSGLKA
jgi:DNA (cytosine-5)-methyltransferase 1